MKYLVIGSNSFAGSSFIFRALSNGFDVVGVSRSMEPHSIFLPYKSSPKFNQYQFYQCDINRDLDFLKSTINEYKPDIIVDFAGQGMVAESWGAPEQWYQTNIVSKVILHDFLRKCDWLKKYVRISTPEVYGSSDSLISEDAEFNPSTPYAVSHAAIDMSLMAFYRNYGFPVVFTRFANFYGPSQQLYRIIPRTVIYAKLGKKLQLHGGGKSVRAFIYGMDVASGIMSVIEKGVIGETYHFSTDEFVSIKELVSIICERMGVDFEDFVENSEDRPGKDQAYFMSFDKAKKELDWKPVFSLETGIDHTIDWVDKNFDIIRDQPWNYIHKL